MLLALKGFIAAVCVAAFIAAPLLAQAPADEVRPDVQRLYAEAKTAEHQGDSATAIAKYRAILRIAPDLAPAYNNLGMLYFKRHEYVQTVPVLEHGLRIDDDMPTAIAMLGLSYVELGDDRKAEPLLRRALHADPSNDDVRLSLAHVLIASKKDQEAIQLVNEYLSHHPKDQAAWYLLGKTYLQMSEDALAKVQEIDPNSYVAHEIAGEIDESMRNYDGALLEFKKAVDVAPRQPGTHLRLGNIYWVTGRWQPAQTEFRLELTIAPTDCTARWKLANSILEANGSAGEALEDLNHSIESCPQLIQARVDRARALIKLSRQREALPDLLLAVKDSPTEPSIHFLLASVYRAEGQMDKVKQELDAYRELQQQASAAVAERAHEETGINNTNH